jgi:hypothetical protein
MTGREAESGALHSGSAPASSKEGRRKASNVFRGLGGLGRRYSEPQPDWLSLLSMRQAGL